MKYFGKKRLKLLAFIFGIYLLFSMSRLIYTAFKERREPINVTLKDFDNLYTKDEFRNIKLLTTTVSKQRDTVSGYIYSERFNVFVYRIMISNDGKLKDILSCNREVSPRSNAIYTRLPSYNFEMYLKTGNVGKISNLQLKYDGSLIYKIASNDSVICYYLKFKTFSLAYDSQDKDIIARADNAELPGSLIFIKRNKMIYIMIMTVRNGDENFAPSLLYDITRH